MGDEDDGLPLQSFQQTAVEDVSAHVDVHGRQRVVQQVDVCVTVDCSRQTDPLLLASRQVDASFTYLI